MKHCRWLVFLAVSVALTGCGASAERLNNRGNDSFAAEDFEEAMQNYTSAQQENPDLAEPYYNAGNAQYRQNDLDKAVAQLEQSLRTADDELTQKAFYNLGNTYFQAEDWPAAIEAYQQALLIDPDDVDAKTNLELALKKLQEQQQQQQQQNQQQQQSQGEGNPQQQENQDQQGQQQESDQQDNNENEQDEAEGSGQGQQPDEPDQSGGPPQQEPQQSGGGFSREEAEQLLDALGQDSQTLQERLQQRLGGGPAPRPEQDW